MKVKMVEAVLKSTFVRILGSSRMCKIVHEAGAREIGDMVREKEVRVKSSNKIANSN